MKKKNKNKIFHYADSNAAIFSLASFIFVFS